MSINSLPKEGLSSIINFTCPSRQELLNYSLVSKFWNEVTCSNLVWASIADREGIKTIGKSDVTIREFFRSLDSRQIHSNDELIEKFQQFLHSCSIQKNCRFRCILKVGRGYEHLTVEIAKAGRHGPNFYVPFLGSKEIEENEEYFCADKPENGDFNQILAVPPLVISYLRRGGPFSVSQSFNEPFYGAGRPEGVRYVQISHEWGNRAITISIPLKYAYINQAQTPLARQLEYLSASKLGKVPLTPQREYKSLAMGIGVVVLGYFVASRMIS